MEAHIHHKIVRADLRKRKSKDKTPKKRENLPTMGASSSKSSHDSSYHGDNDKRPPQLNRTIPALTFYGSSSTNHRPSLVTPDKNTPKRSIFASSDEDDVIEISPEKKPTNHAGQKRSPEKERQKHISEFIDVTGPKEANMSRSNNNTVEHREPPKKKHVAHYPSNQKPEFNGFKNNLTPIKGSSASSRDSHSTPQSRRDPGNIFEKLVSSTPSAKKAAPKRSLEGLECKQCKYDTESCCEQMLICTNYIGKVIEKTSSLDEEKQRLLGIIGRLRDENSSMKDEYDAKWMSKFKLMLNSLQVILK